MNRGLATVVVVNSVALLGLETARYKQKRFLSV